MFSLCSLLACPSPIFLVTFSEAQNFILRTPTQLPNTFLEAIFNNIMRVQEVSYVWYMCLFYGFVSLLENFAFSWMTRKSNKRPRLSADKTWAHFKVEGCDEGEKNT